MLTPTDLIIPFGSYEREQFISSHRGHYPDRIIELVTGTKLRMAAKRIPRAKKVDTRHNGAPATRNVQPTTGKPKTIAVPVAHNTIILTTPDRAEKVQKRFAYLTDFKK